MNAVFTLNQIVPYRGSGISYREFCQLGDKLKYSDWLILLAKPQVRRVSLGRHLLSFHPKD